MTRDEAIARLTAMRDEATAALLAHGLDDVRDAAIAGAIADADAELDHAAHHAHGLVVRALRRRRDAIIALHEYLAQAQRALRALAGETT